MLLLSLKLIYQGMRERERDRTEIKVCVFYHSYIKVQLADTIEQGSKLAYTLQGIEERI